MNITSLATAVKNALAGLLPTTLGIKTAANSLAVTLPSDISTLPTGKAAVTTSVNRTRPADVVAYAVNDVVADSTTAATIITFANMAKVNAGTGYITKALLRSNSAVLAAAFRLHLYSTAPAVVNDNLPLPELWADNAGYLGFIDFDITSSEGTGSDSCKSLNRDVKLAFTSGAANTSIFGVLQTKTVFTPVSGQIFSIKLTSEQN